MFATSAVALALTLSAPAQVDATASQGYAQILKSHVKQGRVNYKALAGPDMAKLDKYLAAVAQAKLPAAKQARMAFYIDAYNALVLKSVLTNGRPRSVLDVKGFFDGQKHRVAGKSTTLNDLEKKHLNAYAKDPRTHFVLVCAAVGCPILESTPFTGSKLDQRLNAATRRYLTSKTGGRVSDGGVALSKIFDWYKADFGGPEGVVKFVRKHLPKAQAAKMGGSPKVSFIDYNWTLNQR